MARAAPSSRPRAASDDPRSRKMRAVLAACRRLGIDSEARKDIQQQLVGVGSMAAMNESQLGQLLDHLNRDWRGSNPARPHLAKIKALWWSLYWLGEIEEPGEKALSSYVRRQTGVAALRFLDSRHSFAVVEGLKKWLGRVGVVWKTDSQIAELERHWPGRGRAEWDRWAVLFELHKRLFCGDHVLASAERYVAGALGFDTHPLHWSNRQLDDAIRILGKKWRSVRPVKEATDG